MLEVEGLGVRYDHTTAVDGVSLRVDQGEIVALVGANGAGKSSLLKAIAGLVPQSAGRVAVGGRDVSAWPSYRRVAAGVALVLEGRRTFGEMTVAENLELGSYLRTGALSRERVEADLELVLRLFPRLRQRHGQLAGTLSGGEQQMLAIGRAMMSAPRVLLLDEPSLGLAPGVQLEIVGLLQELHRERGMAILVAEQNAVLGLDIARRGYVLHGGRVVLEGTAAELAARANLIDVYLGSAVGAGH